MYMHTQRAALFSSEDGKTFDAAPFLRALETGDLYSKKAAATILALLFQVLDLKRPVFEGEGSRDRDAFLLPSLLTCPFPLPAP